MEETSLPLLDRLRKKEPLAWTTLERGYGPYVKRLVLEKYLRDPHDIQDAWQETLLGCHHGIAKFEHRGPGTFRGWLLEIARNKCFDLQKRLNRFPRGSGDSSVQDQLGQLPDPQIAIDEHEQHIRGWVETMLEELCKRHPQEHVKVFEQYKLQRENVKEVAINNRVSVSNVHVICHRLTATLEEIKAELAELFVL